MKLRVATWNINSVRLRLPLVERMAQLHRPDVICLQEIKCREELFPFDAIRALGYEHISLSGQAGYHGVATFSKLPLQQLPRQRFCGTEDARHLGCVIQLPNSASTIAIHNLYIPAGGDIPDPEINPKFKQKLAYLKALAEWSADCPKNEAAIILGDFNVAPLETDVWSHKQLLKVVSHTPIEVEHLSSVQAAGQWCDVVRNFILPSERLYSWWSYRAQDWAASDRGRRLDHLWASPTLSGHAETAIVFKDARSWDRPSDHVPVIVDFDV